MSKAAEIFKEELKKELPEIGEEVALKLYLVVKDVILPRIAIEGEGTEKTIASGAILVAGALDPLFKGLIDKIDGQVG